MTAGPQYCGGHGGVRCSFVIAATDGGISGDGNVLVDDELLLLIVVGVVVKFRC